MEPEIHARALRLAIVAPLYESVPPRLYGGTERVVSWLTEELVRLGQDVTLFAAGDSRTAARLHAVAPRGLRLARECRDPAAWHVAMLHDVAERADDFDLIHFHLDHAHFPLVRALGLPALTTLHGRLDLPELAPLFERYGDMALVSISDAQRAPLPRAHWAGTVYHGLPRDLLPFSSGPGEYLAFLGRIAPEKGPERAIRIARRAGVPLKIAAKVEATDRAYFEAVIEPMLGGQGVEFIGEIGEHEKAEFLGRAAALLFPIDWPEPFGVVMIEALACGTPVIAFPCGSVPEIVVPGVNGSIAADEHAAVAAVAAIPTLDRATCRRDFEARFTADRMARDYLELYRARVGRSRSGASIRDAA
jgi:glycosyltransferase involved in cell wall biosynthesis